MSRGLEKGAEGRGHFAYSCLLAFTGLSFFLVDGAFYRHCERVDCSGHFEKRGI